jgi:hypothetical protein
MLLVKHNFYHMLLGKKWHVAYDMLLVEKQQTHIVASATAT